MFSSKVSCVLTGLWTTLVERKTLSKVNLVERINQIKKTLPSDMPRFQQKTKEIYSGALATMNSDKEFLFKNSNPFAAGVTFILIKYRPMVNPSFFDRFQQSEV